MRIDRLPQLPQQGNEVLFVGRLPAALSRVLPVDVQTVKLVLIQEGDDILDEPETGPGVAGDLGEFPGFLLPASDGDHVFSFRVLISQAGEPLVTVTVHHAEAAVDVYANEAVDYVGAKPRVDVGYVEFTGVRTVDGQATEVADYLLWRIILILLRSV